MQNDANGKADRETPDFAKDIKPLLAYLKIQTKYAVFIGLIIVALLVIYLNSCIRHGGIVCGYEWVDGSDENLINFRKGTLKPSTLLSGPVKMEQDGLPLYVPEGWKIFYVYETEIEEGDITFSANHYFGTADFRKPPLHKNRINESGAQRVEIPVEPGLYRFSHRPSRAYNPETGDSRYSMKYWVVWGITR